MSQCLSLTDDTCVSRASIWLNSFAVQYFIYTTLLICISSRPYPQPFLSLSCEYTRLTSNIQAINLSVCISINRKLIMLCPCTVNFLNVNHTDKTVIMAIDQ